MSKADPAFSWWDRLNYRLFVIPLTRTEVHERSRNRTPGSTSGPPQGPGRVDTFNPYKRLLGFDMNADDTVGTADLPSLWNQRVREGLWLHWDGNNDRVEERNKSAAIGAGATPDSLDLAVAQAHRGLDSRPQAAARIRASGCDAGAGRARPAGLPDGLRVLSRSRAAAKVGQVVDIARSRPIRSGCDRSRRSWRSR